MSSIITSTDLYAWLAEQLINGLLRARKYVDWFRFRGPVTGRLKTKSSTWLSFEILGRDKYDQKR